MLSFILALKYVFQNSTSMKMATKLEKVTLTDTTVGRAIFSLILPKGLPFEIINVSWVKSKFQNY